MRDPWCAAFVLSSWAIEEEQRAVRAWDVDVEPAVDARPLLLSPRSGDAHVPGMCQAHGRISTRQSHRVGFDARQRHNGRPRLGRGTRGGLGETRGRGSRVSVAGRAPGQKRTRNHERQESSNLGGHARLRESVAPSRSLAPALHQPACSASQRAREDSNLRPTVSALPRLSPRTGPSLHPPGRRWAWVGCRALPSVVRTTCGAGVLPGRLTRWSLHLPPAVAHSMAATPRRRLGSGLPATGAVPWVGFPRVHPVRLGPFPGRAPL